MIIKCGIRGKHEEIAIINFIFLPVLKNCIICTCGLVGFNN